MRTPLLVANWKMHKTVAEATAFTTDFLPKVTSITDVEIILAPPSTALEVVSTTCRSTPVRTAAQNIHWEKQGAFTGELSATMVKDAGASHVIIGHSERRMLFGDNNKTVNRKVKASLDAGLIPIVCIGETIGQRDSDETQTVLTQQVKGALNGITEAEIGSVIVAYEPVWAIGTGRTATPDQVQNTHVHIRQRLFELSSPKSADQCRLLYGGSVKAANTAELLAQPDVDGALIGGASLDPNDFLEIVVQGRPRRP